MSEVEVKIELYIDGTRLISQSNSASCAVADEALCLIESAGDGLDTFVSILEANLARFPLPGKPA